MRPLVYYQPFGPAGSGLRDFPPGRLVAPLELLQSPANATKDELQPGADTATGGRDDRRPGTPPPPPVPSIDNKPPARSNEPKLTFEELEAERRELKRQDALRREAEEGTRPPRADRGSASSPGQGGGEAPDSEAAAAEASAEAARTTGDTDRARALRAAGRASQSMLEGLESGDGAAGAPSAPPPPGSTAGSKPAGIPEPAAAANASQASTERGLIAQGVIAYKEEYARTGLGVRENASGSPYLYNEREKRPATAPERDALVAAISAQPAALMREPGLYSAMPRQEFAAMRTQAVAKGPAADGPLKDVAVTSDGRDLVWARSCDKVTGKCNDSAERSYQTGQPVRGAELSRMWAKARTALAAGAGRSSSPLRFDRRLLSRIMGRTDSGSTVDDALPAAGAAATGGSAARGAIADPGGEWASQGAQPTPRSASVLAFGAAFPGSRSPWWRVSAVIGMVLLLAGLRRRLR